MRVSWRIALVLAMGCGGPAMRHVPQLSDLSSPYYAATEMGVDTGSTTALDGNGDLWLASSGPVRTTDGFRFVRAARDDERRRIAEAFNALPAGPDPTCASHSSLTSSMGGAVRTWIVCTDARGGAVAPYAAAVSSLANIY